MKTNSFKAILEEDRVLYTRFHDEKVKNGIWNTLGYFKLFGDIVDVYLLKTVDVFVLAAGGDRRKDRRVADR